MSGKVDAKLKRSLAKLKAVEAEFKAVTKDIRSPDYMKGLGNFAADMIKKRARLGSGVAEQGSEKKPLKPLSESYVEARKQDKAGGKLSDKTTPKKSNLTRTGELLDSITAKQAKASTVNVGPSGQRSDGKRNEKVGEYVSDAGRPFNNLSGIELKRVKDKIRLDVKAAIGKRKRLSK